MAISAFQFHKILQSAGSMWNHSFARFIHIQKQAPLLKTKSLLCKCLLRKSASVAKLYMPDPWSLSPKARKIIGCWLLGCAALTWGTTAVGAITRLTESGLSIVQWNVVRGILPPLSLKDWEAEFEKYKKTPHYDYMTSSKEMSMSSFKFIWLMEYMHRLMGRSVGLTFFLPLAYFWRKGWITKPLRRRSVLFTTLILLQGAMGWYMVRSGLSQKASEEPGTGEIPRVSQYRLAGHMFLAMVLYTALLWSGLNHLIPPHFVSKGPKPTTTMLRKFNMLNHVTHGFLFLAFTGIITGAFVAGLDAGLVYNTWPKVGDNWVPSELLEMTPKWKNFLENPATVQYVHRGVGEGVMVAAPLLWFYTRKLPLPGNARLAVNVVTLTALVQVLLGITTLVHYVPTSLAVAHQSGSIALVTAGTWLMKELRRIPK